MNQGSQPAYHLCFSRSPSCSGAVPCKACLFRIEERALPGAMMVDGQLLQDLYVALNALQQVGIHPASLGIAVRTPEEQADAFVQGYFAGLQRLHQDMLGELRGLVMATPIAPPGPSSYRPQNVPMTAAAAYAQPDPWGGGMHTPPVQSPLHGSFSAHEALSGHAVPMTDHGNWASAVVATPSPLPALVPPAPPAPHQQAKDTEVIGSIFAAAAPESSAEAARKAAQDAVMAAAAVENARLKAQAETELAQRLEVRKRRAAQETESARQAEVEKLRLEALTRPMDEEEILASIESSEEDEPPQGASLNGIVPPSSSSSSAAS